MLSIQPVVQSEAKKYIPKHWTPTTGEESKCCLVPSEIGLPLNSQPQFTIQTEEFKQQEYDQNESSIPSVSIVNSEEQEEDQPSYAG